CGGWSGPHPDGILERILFLRHPAVVCARVLACGYSGLATPRGGPAALAITAKGRKSATIAVGFGTAFVDLCRRCRAAAFRSSNHEYQRSLGSNDRNEPGRPRMEDRRSRSTSGFRRGA